MKIKTYLNSLIRKGTSITEVKDHVSNYVRYIHDYTASKTIAKIKTEKGKKAKIEQRDKIITNVTQNRPTIQAVMEIYANITFAKEMVINKLNTGAKRFPNTFVRTDSGYKVVNEEGYVAIDTIKGNAVKLVDRLEFSYNNFNGIKNWDK